MKRLLKRIYINAIILIVVYVAVWALFPGHGPFDYLEGWAFAATLAALVGVDYLREYIDKLLDQRGDA